MADKQAPNATGDQDERNSSSSAAAAKSGEDRKAASALASLDDHAAAADDGSSRNVDHEAVREAMKNLESVSGAASTSKSQSSSGAATAGKQAAASASAPATRKNVKVDAADVALLVEELDMTKLRATDYLKTHDGDALKALTAYVTV